MTDVSSRPARLNIGVVGAGRVGTVLAAALARAGHHVTGVHAVSRQSTDRADRLLPNAARRTPDEITTTSDLVLLTTPDDVLADVVAGLAQQDAFQPGQLVVHTSGRHGLAVLDPATRLGVLPLALHPVMTFAGAPEDIDRLAGASFGVTAPEPLRAVAEALVIEMGGEPVWVPEEARPVYHAALAWGANYLATITTSAAQLLTGAGVDNPQRLLAPLLGATLDNALRRGDTALTGPVARGDAETVRVHIEALREHAPELIPAYVALARLTAERALQSGLLKPALAEGLLEVLAAQ
ncbi:MAG TPA: DUF2520 domain-containing protein [Mycobacteriales bacterium]|nr:DUF2520 domain-containing protein [Mycobacteriales bacterium]